MIPTADLTQGSPFVSYSYAYPHKTAYRRLAEAMPLRELWQGERRESLFLYLHVPFCEYRCGFCNLFTRSNPAAGLPGRYLEQVGREAEQVRPALGEARFARLAIGGGTPTFLDCSEWETLFEIVAGVMGAEPGRIPVSVEASPATVSAEKLALLREFGVDRLSLGVQTFDDAESRRLGRPQRRSEAEHALSLIRDAGFPVLNIDLIYGGEGQTLTGWLDSVRAALNWRPEELYLYPLYVREQTGLGRLHHDWDDQRLNAYRQARELLVSAGYGQVSLRMFRAAGTAADAGPVYCCQSDGMVGLGCGARSYTRGLHYSSEYAVSQTGVRAILSEYLERQADSFAHAHYGFVLDADEQRRRYVILSLLQREGISLRDYTARFGSDLFHDLPQLRELEPLGLASQSVEKRGPAPGCPETTQEIPMGQGACPLFSTECEPSAECLRLTDAGLERSDAIGPWLYSERVHRLMEESACR